MLLTQRRWRHDFLLDTATERARRVLKAHSTITLSNEAFDRFYEALDAPAEAVPELVALFGSAPVSAG